MSPSHARYHFSLRARRLLERLFKLHCYTFRGNGIGIETGGGGRGEEEETLFTYRYNDTFVSYPRLTFVLAFERRSRPPLK